MILEARSGDEAAIIEFADALVRDLRSPLAALKLSVARERISHVSPAPCAEFVREAIRSAAADLGISARDLPSGAGHDGVFLSRIGPIGMIFVPCREGRSHAPEEIDRAASGGRRRAGSGGRRAPSRCDGRLRQWIGRQPT